MAVQNCSIVEENVRSQSLVFKSNSKILIASINSIILYNIIMQLINLEFDLI